MRYPEHDWINPKIEIRQSSVHGRGMFANAKFNGSVILVVWGGPSTTKEEAEQARARGKIVVMQPDDDLYTIEERGEYATYFMNHSCDSNVWMRNGWTLVARRDILVGEELTLDYALVEGDESFLPDWEGACGSSECRKKITGQDWLLPQIQQRYKGYFSPLINKRIARLNPT